MTVPMAHDLWSTQTVTTRTPMVDGVAVALAGERLDAAELRQRVNQELLRQAAQRAGLLAADDPAPEAGAMSEAAVQAVESLLDREILVQEPDEHACRRHYAAHPTRFAQGEQVRARHILFAVTGQVDVQALRQRAEACLIDLRAQGPGDGDRFAAIAREQSNCPSGAEGGELGWLLAADCMPEFARELFGHSEVGVLPRLVRSRHGFHVVDVQARRPGRVPPFEAVHASVAALLRQRAFATALRAYLMGLAEGACIEGVDLGCGTSPSMQ